MTPIHPKFAKVARHTVGGFLAIAALAAAGCGEALPDRVALHRTRGAITYRGQPIPGAFIAFHPKTPFADVPAPRASVKGSGEFHVSTFDSSDGAPEGEYVVTVQWYKPIQKGGEVIAGPNVIPRKYAAAATSGLTVRIASGDNELPPIRL